jgi:hypothetical protein
MRVERLMDIPRGSWGSTRSNSGEELHSARPLPLQDLAGETYDVGDFDRVLDRAPRGRRGRLRRPEGGERQGGQGPRPRPLLLHRIDPRRPERDHQGRLRRGRDGRPLCRHPVERPGPRDGLRPVPAPARRHPVREDPLRAGRQRPDRQGRRHRRVALGHHAGQLDQRGRRLLVTRFSRWPRRSWRASRRHPSRTASSA